MIERIQDIQISRSRKFLGIFTLFLIFSALAIFFSSSQQIGFDRGIVNSESCKFNENFSITPSQLEYYPVNETATLEIKSAHNINSKYLQRLEITTLEGKIHGEGNTRIRINGNTSKTGLIAKTKP